MAVDDMLGLSAKVLLWSTPPCGRAATSRSGLVQRISHKEAWLSLPRGSKYPIFKLSINGFGAREPKCWILGPAGLGCKNDLDPNST